jgi:acetyl-CoA C-acetyltransferase
VSTTDPRSPCIIGVAARTWHPGAAQGAGAPEPLDMWEEVARAAAADTTRPGVLEQLESLQIVYCQTWQYDDAPARLAARLGADPAHRHYSGIGGTTTQQLIDATAERMLRGELDLALVTSAEALATQRAWKRRGERFPYSFKPPEKRPFPWESPPDPLEVAHEVFQAWLTFAVFDNARRAHLGVTLDDYRLGIGDMLAPMTEVAAANPHAWFRVRRDAHEIVTPTPENRMVGYPYTKYAVAVMDVDMAAALVVATHARADALGIPADRRVYLRGWGDARDPVLVAAHPDMWRSPAMSIASGQALEGAGITADDVAHLDLYSCFASSLHFACDALGLSPTDGRGLTVTGGLPYHGGPASGYLTHSIAAMVERLRADPGAFGLVSGVGMHMTKHVFGCYSTVPGPVRPPGPGPEAPARPVVATHDGDATVAAYSVVHGRDGGPEWALLVCDAGGGTRAYARSNDPDLCARAEADELVGTRVRLAPTVVDGPAGPAHVNVATEAGAAPKTTSNPTSN